jgi:iron-sulfur cluster repair protein YtfE (RIC family)
MTFTQTRTSGMIDMNTETAVADMTVNEMIRRYPATVEIFNRYGMDACCGGAASVVDAARRDGAEVDSLLAELRQIVRDVP